MWFWNKQKIEIPNNPVACTMEAKLCPDGSYVGRTGPKCEFSPCPEVVDIKHVQGTLSGSVTLGPTCPVERIPPDPNCAPKPFSTSISILNSENTKILKTINSDTNGAFSVNLDSGTYILQAKGGAVLPRCSQVSVVIKSGEQTKTEISCDTGIR